MGVGSGLLAYVRTELLQERQELELNSFVDIMGRLWWIATRGWVFFCTGDFSRLINVEDP